MIKKAICWLFGHACWESTPIINARGVLVGTRKRRLDICFRCGQPMEWDNEAK